MVDDEERRSHRLRLGDMRGVFLLYTPESESNAGAKGRCDI